MAIFLAMDGPPGPFMVAVDVPPDHLRRRKWSPFATDGPPMQQPFRRSLATVVKRPSKAPYLRHVKGKISCSSYSYYFIHL